MSHRTMTFDSNYISQRNIHSRTFNNYRILSRSARLEKAPNLAKHAHLEEKRGKKSFQNHLSSKIIRLW